MGQVCPCFAFASSPAAGRTARAPPLLPATDDKVAIRTRGLEQVCGQAVSSKDDIDDVPFKHIAVGIGPPPTWEKEEPDVRPLDAADEGLLAPRAGFDLKLDPVDEEARVPQVATASSVTKFLLPASPRVISVVEPSAPSLSMSAKDPGRFVQEAPSFNFAPVSVDTHFESQDDSDDEDGFDLARLCSAMRSLEQSANRAKAGSSLDAGSISGGSKFQAQTLAGDASSAAAGALRGSTAKMQTSPSQITRSGSSPEVESPRSALRAPLIVSGSTHSLTPHSATPTNAMSMSRDRRLSSGKGSPTGSEDAFGGAGLPRQTHAGLEAPAGRVQGAQKMNAWMERVLAKGGGPLGGLPSPDNGGLVPLDILPPACLSDAAASASAAAAAAATTSAAAPMAPVVSVVPVVLVVPVAPVAPAAAAAAFNLEVSLSGDVLGVMKFTAVDGVEGPCSAFVTEHRLREIFLAPLTAHAELMVHMGKRSDTVDVVDLL